VIPVTDAVRTRTFPYVNIAIIVACTLVFIYEVSISAADLDRFLNDYAVIPRDLYAWWQSPSGVNEPLTAFTAAFLHGGWLHLGGNMLFLWVFGDNVEDALGHVKYAAFYLVAAAVASATQVAFDTSSVVPVVGASGAIAGVLAGYLVLYPRAKVRVVIPVLFFLGAWPIPAFVLIIIWFLMQLFAGVAEIGNTAASSGIAVWAHIGGFLAGLAIMLVARPFIPRRSLSTMRTRGPVKMW
jgi:membrane associated rhomboid family serine protease